MDCGILAKGFCRVHCYNCGRDGVVAFSCKGRGFCPSCGGRRMADTAAYLVDSVLPEVPYRQWVITFPFRVRYLIAFDRELCADVKRIAVRTVMSHLRLQARRRGIRNGRGGAVVFLQRFGGSVNLNPHLHLLAVDGVYTAGSAGGSAIFQPLPPPTTFEVGELTAKIRARVLRRLAARGLLPDREEFDDDLLPFDSADLAGCYAASIAGRAFLDKRKGVFVQRVGRVSGAPFFEFSGERCAEADGFTLHANVRIDGRKRKHLERLLRYMARPAVAASRLKLLPDGSVLYRLRHAYHDGTKALVFPPLVFIERLCALIPPPRQNLVTYFGVFAPNAALRADVVPEPRPEEVTRHCRKSRSGAARATRRRKKYTWADLMKRVFEIDVLRCPFCHSRRKLIAQITEVSVIRTFLACLGLPLDPPEMKPALWPP